MTINDSDYQKIKENFQKIALWANLGLVSIYWDYSTHDWGTFKFDNQTDANTFCQLMPRGYAAEIIGNTNSVNVEIV